jgi:DNA-binding HxlR family transcriptional regulator
MEKVEKPAHNPAIATETTPEHLAAYCPTFARAIDIFGRRWMGLVIGALMAGPRRFNEMLAAIPGISDPLLTQRLRELEAEGLVERRVLPTSPVRVEYALTEAGHDLEQVLVTISRWAHRWLDDAARPLSPASQPTATAEA